MPTHFPSSSSTFPIMECKSSKASCGTGSDRSPVYVGKKRPSSFLASRHLPSRRHKTSQLVGSSPKSVWSCTNFVSSCGVASSPLEIDPPESARQQQQQQQMPETTTFPGNEEECLAAGWPSWLVTAAGEALHGWIPRSNSSFRLRFKIGEGSYGSVYKAVDLETSKVVALKKLTFSDDEEDAGALDLMATEIKVLRKLNHPNVVKLEGLIASKKRRKLYLVLEYVENPLSDLIRSNTGVSQEEVRSYMQQILKGLEHCHSHGVLHRDIKPSNILVDNYGVVKIADFGVSTFFDPDKDQEFSNNLTTLWYRPPELLLGATEYGVSADLWSVGCTFGELLLGSPLIRGFSEMDQVRKVFKLCGIPHQREYWRRWKVPRESIFSSPNPHPSYLRKVFEKFPPSALALLEILLCLAPELRGTAASALDSDYFR